MKQIIIMTIIILLHHSRNQQNMQWNVNGLLLDGMDSLIEMILHVHISCGGFDAACLSNSEKLPNAIKNIEHYLDGIFQ